MTALEVLRQSISEKKNEIKTVRKRIKDKTHNSPSQLTVLRKRRKILLSEIRTLEREFDAINPENKL